MNSDKFDIKKHVSSKLGLESDRDLRRRKGITQHLHKCGYISPELYQHIMSIINERLGESK